MQPFLVALLLVCAYATAAMAESRKWKDATGDFSVEAEFLELKGTTVHLRNKDDKVIKVPLAQLSKADQEYISEHLSTSAALFNGRLRDASLLLLTFDSTSVDALAKPELAKDASGKENHGTIRGATPVAGAVGQGLKFDGRDDYVEIPTLYKHLTADREQLTVSMWLNPTAKVGVGFDAGFVADSITIFLDAERGRFIMPPKVGGGQAGFALPRDGEWRHVCAVWDGEFQRAYVDGKLAGEIRTKSRGVLTPQTLGGKHTVFVGTQVKSANRGGRFFQGGIDEVGVFAVALEAADVRKLWQMGRDDRSVAALGSAKAVAGDGSKPTVPTKDIPAKSVELWGWWKIVRAHESGKDKGRDYLGDLFHFQPDKFTHFMIPRDGFGEDSEDYELEVDAKGSPGKYEFDSVGGLWEGIYKIQGTNLTLSENVGKRPTEFTSTPENGNRVIVLKRSKPPGKSR